MAVFRPPQKKKGTGNDFFTPLPVPIASINKTTPKTELWNYYDGLLQENHVIVDLRGDIHNLNTQGFFGKIMTSSCSNDDPIRLKAPLDFCRQINTLAQLSDSSTSSNEHSCTAEMSQSDTVDHQDLKESLILTFEEAFFLSYGLGCLFVKDSKGEMLSIDTQWRVYCERNARFPVTYSAYHHFRSKGWVPKDGIKYGGDLVLYRKGPPYYHSSYIVVITSVDEDLQETPFRGTNNRSFNWATLSGQLRLGTSVSKELMLCHVAVPKKCLQSDSCSTSCLTDFRIQETIVSRWISSKEREKELLDIDCDF